MVAGKGYAASKYAPIIDSIGVVHAIAANLIILLGAKTEYFAWIAEKYLLAARDIAEFSKKHSALTYVYDYVDLPVYSLFRGLAISRPNDLIFTYAMAEVIILLSSLLYCFIAYVVLRLITGLVER